VRARSAHLSALTGLRFWLAIWVIFQHVTGPRDILGNAALSLPAPAYSLLRSGYLAVTTFFVLSGFVLARTYSATPWTRITVLQYARARVARVYPVYLLSLVMVAPFMLAYHGAGKAGFIAGYVLLLQGWLGHLPVGWNTPAWTLSCEMFFYAGFPLALAWLRGAGWRKTLLTAAAACLLSRVLLALGVPDAMKPLVHLSDFVMGIAASCAYDLLLESGHAPRGVWLFGPAAALSVALIAWPSLLPSGLDLNTATRPLNALLIMGLALGCRAVSGRITVFLGKSSYAMYILHVPIFWWYSRTTNHPSALIYIVLVIALSSLTYRYLEEPANRYLRK
jgi:peptidoglycan/LPS O-acetylase OafA/YrhL